MATYKSAIGETSSAELRLLELDVYGSQRLGVLSVDQKLTDLPEPGAPIKTMEKGNKHFELTNHLGNVLSVISDRLFSTQGTTLGKVARYTADLVSSSDYYPFGMQMPGRKVDSGKYRFGFNGMEKDDEVKGSGNSYFTQYRIYDSRIGRWLSLDPKREKYPQETNYCINSNNLLIFKDKKGDDPITAIVEGMTAFGLEAGLSFIENFVFKDMTLESSIDNIDWEEAAYEGLKAGALSFFAPTGTQTAMRVAKIAKSRSGKLVIDLTTNMVEEATKRYLKGEYNDEDGDFDSDLMMDDFTNLFMESAIQTLIDNKMGKKADKLINEFSKTNKVAAEKYRKLNNKVNNNESIKRYNQYQKKAANARDKQVKAGKKVVVSQAKEQVASKANEVTTDKVTKKNK